jgi:dipeptide/tripeptide permease
MTEKMKIIYLLYLIVAFLSSLVGVSLLFLILPGFGWHQALPASLMGTLAGFIAFILGDLRKLAEALRKKENHDH